MTKFLIYHYDDDQSTLDNVESYIISLNQEFGSYDVQLDLKPFLNQVDLMKGIKISQPDLIILDMYEAKPELKRVGEQVLETLKNMGLNIQVIIFTQGSREGNSIEYYDLYKNYRFLYEPAIIKSIKANDLKDAIKRKVIKDCFPELFSYDQDDIFLKADIIAIGQGNLNDIIFKIKNDRKIASKVTLERLGSGFSGAAVFKMGIDNQVEILKVSREKDKLKNELERAILLYKKFPARFRIDIKSTEYSNEETLAILIEEVKMGIPLFKWLKNADETAIIDFFDNLYFNGGLSEHYISNTWSSCKFSIIFSGFDPGKISIIKKTITDLNPILEHFSKELQFDALTLLNFLQDKSYQKLTTSGLLGSKYEKPLVLSHGDFHSNNIMVQHNQPVIIDSGGLRYDFWCIDICRLIVHLFTLGIDDNTFAFFDLNNLTSMYTKVDSLINFKKLEKTPENAGHVNAINWLLENSPKIFDANFTKWEFQLGLMKEFLQASYRVSTIPPSRRALALLAAYKCLITANESLD